MAYVGLAESYVLADLPLRESEIASKAASMKALEIDPTLGEPHAALGNFKHVLDRDYPGAEAEFRRAIELSPNYPTAYHWYAEFLVFQGRFDEGLAQYKKALELDPYSLAIGTDYGIALYNARKYDQAIDYLKKLEEMDPNYVRTHDYLADIYETTGQFEEAIDEQGKRLMLQGFDPSKFAKGKELLLNALKASGPKGYWTQILKFMNEDAKEGHTPSAVYFARVYARLDEKDKAFEYLQKLSESESNGFTNLKVGPEWDNLRDDPRFQELLRKLGF
jgi:tetratricopeptide (TPR) repeat protein